MPATLAALNLEMCDLPCWIGIVPGETLVGEAKLQLQRVYGNQAVYQLLKRNEFNFDIVIAASGERLNVKLGAASRNDFDRSIVSDLNLLFRSASGGKTSLTVGQVLAAVEMPASVGQAPSANAYVALFFLKNHQVLVYLDDILNDCRKMSITEPIGSMYLSEALSERTLTLLFQKRWEGFKSCYDFTND